MLKRSRVSRSLKGAGVATAMMLSLAGCEIAAVAMMNMVETTVFTVNGSKLLMSGEINSQTYDQFIKVISQNPQIKVLVEGNVPGSLDDDTMIKLAYKVRALGLDTHLTSTSEIYSGGVDLYLAGVHRTMERGAVIGVHSWSDGRKEAKDYPRSSPVHEQNRKYIEDMLGRDDFYWFTIYAAPADDILIMTTEQIRKYGLLTGPIQK